MGVVHLARRGDGRRVALKVLRPHIVGDDEARRRLAREVGSLSRIRSQWVAEIVDADPWAPVPYVATRYVPGLSLHDHVHEEGPITGKDLTWFAACLAEGVASRARGRRAAPRREALQRADGGPDADPHRLRPGPGRRRPEADPHRLAARARPATSRPRSCTATTPPPASDVHSWAATVAFAGDRPAAVRPRPVDGDHGPGPPRRARPLRHPRRRCASCSPTASTPSRSDRPTLRRASWAGCGRRSRPPSRDAGGPARAGQAHDAVRRPLAPRRTPGRPTCCRADRPVGAAGTKLLTEHQTVLERDPRALPPPTAAAGRAAAVRRSPSGPARRPCSSSVALLCGGVVAAYPWFGSVALAARSSGCCAAARWPPARRASGGGVRGRKWYDGAQLLVRGARGTWSGRSRAP